MAWIHFLPLCPFWPTAAALLYRGGSSATAYLSIARVKCLNITCNVLRIASTISLSEAGEDNIPDTARTIISKGPYTKSINSSTDRGRSGGRGKISTL